jgi:mannitol-1-phosphate 5-dehydrogenase
MTILKKAVVYGAGNIGRGFIGQLFYESGYRTCFIEVNQQVVAEINTQGSYPVKIVANNESHEVIVGNVYAVDGRDSVKTAGEILDCEIMATAVGVNVLSKIADSLSEGLKLRYLHDKPPINIIICENLIDAGKFLKDLVMERCIGCEKYIDGNVGFIEASIGRMVPVMTDEMRGDNYLRIWSEPYSVLPVDKDAFKGEIPRIKNLYPVSPFSAYIKRKLFIHNMGHALCAYIGALRGCKYIYEAVGDPYINNIARKAMQGCARALNREYGMSLDEIYEHIDDLLERFSNVSLGDTVERVAREPERKLKPNDRLTGAALYCISQGEDPSYIVKAIAAALAYAKAQGSREEIIGKYCGITVESPLYAIILQELENLS